MIRVLDIGIGNIDSTCNMLDYLNIEFEKVNRVEEDTIKLILIGNGNFSSVIEKLKLTGNDIAIKNIIKNKHSSILGICIGAQVFGNYSEEGNCYGLGVLDFDILKIESSKYLKVPNVGWHELQTIDYNLNSPIANSRYYFSHSYEMTNFKEKIISSHICVGEKKIVSSFQHNNIIGVQFHPEKSHKFGFNLFRKFSSNEI